MQINMNILPAYSIRNLSPNKTTGQIAFCSNTKQDDKDKYIRQLEKNNQVLTETVNRLTEKNSQIKNDYIALQDYYISLQKVKWIPLVGQIC